MAEEEITEKTSEDNEETEEWHCEQCGGCCRHIAVQIDEPEDEDDYADIMWYLLHDNVNVFIDEEDDWYIEFLTRCSALNDDNSCGVYETRPPICRKYDPDECVKHGEGQAEKFKFQTREDLFAYLKLKGMTYLNKYMQ